MIFLGQFSIKMLLSNLKIHFSDFGAASNPRYLYGLAQLHQLERRRKGEDEDYAVVAIDLSTKDLVRKCLLVNVLKCFIIIFFNHYIC